MFTLQDQFGFCAFVTQYILSNSNICKNVLQEQSSSKIKFFAPYLIYRGSEAKTNLSTVDAVELARAYQPKTGGFSHLCNLV